MGDPADYKYHAECKERGVCYWEGWGNDNFGTTCGKLIHDSKFLTGYLTICPYCGMKIDNFGEE